MKVISAAEAAFLVKNNDTLAVCGFGGRGAPDELLIALNDRFEKSSQPNNLSLVFGIGTGNPKTRTDGLNNLKDERMLRRVICAHVKDTPNISGWINNNNIFAYALPLGIICELLTAISNKEPGVISKNGLGTFCDPRLQGCRMNSKSESDDLSVVSLIDIDNEEYLFYKSFPIDICFIRATSSDTLGNLSDEKEPLSLEQLSFVSAVKACGGTVIAQVEKLVEYGDIHNRNVIIHNSLIDYVVVSSPKNHLQGYDTVDYNPALDGTEYDPNMQQNSISMPLDLRKICARRAALELSPNSIVNIGVGMPDGVSAVAIEEGIASKSVFTIEAGVIGGKPVMGLGFGPSENFEARLRMSDMFTLYHGGYLTHTFLGAAEIDKFGNVNVSSFNGMTTGPGGFIDISQNAKNIIFMCSFTAGGLAVDIDDSSICITNEGITKKFVNSVQQITFSAEQALKNERNVLYITERAVFKLIEGGLKLIEIAPGVDLDKDILNQMEFAPIISDNLKQMDCRIFSNCKMNIA